MRDHRFELLLLAVVGLLDIGHHIHHGHYFETLHLLKVHIALTITIDGIERQDIRGTIVIRLDDRPIFAVGLIIDRDVQENGVRRAVEDRVSLLMGHFEVGREFGRGKRLSVNAGINLERFLVLRLGRDDDKLRHRRKVQDVREVDMAIREPVVARDQLQRFAEVFILVLFAVDEIFIRHHIVLFDKFTLPHVTK